MSTHNVLLVFVLAILAIVASMYLVQSTATEVTAPQSKEFTLRIKGTTLVEGPTTLSVKQGDSVVIRITSDTAEEFHLHGYDRSVDLVPDIESALAFTANASGRFPYELEQHKVELGSLEVLP